MQFRIKATPHQSSVAGVHCKGFFMNPNGKRLHLEQQGCILGTLGCRPIRCQSLMAYCGPQVEKKACSL
eukprot:1043197-Pelagomonas_calceolata.AAC.3